MLRPPAVHCALPDLTLLCLHCAWLPVSSVTSLHLLTLLDSHHRPTRTVRQSIQLYNINNSASGWYSRHRIGLSLPYLHSSQQLLTALPLNWKTDHIIHCCEHQDLRYPSNLGLRASQSNFQAECPVHQPTRVPIQAGRKQEEKLFRQGRLAQ